MLRIYATVLCVIALHVTVFTRVYGAMCCVCAMCLFALHVTVFTCVVYVLCVYGAMCCVCAMCLNFFFPV